MPDACGPGLQPRPTTLRQVDDTPNNLGGVGETENDSTNRSRRADDSSTTAPPQETGLLPGSVTGRVTAVVEQADTAQSIGSGDVPVLGTPRVLALAEAATVSALTRRIPTGLSSVGVAVEMRHVAAVEVGALVCADVVLRDRSGSRLEFWFTVTDADERLLADGVITRRLVNREAFLSHVRHPQNRSGKPVDLQG